jgi:hypothetical protein
VPAADVHFEERAEVSADVIRLSFRLTGDDLALYQREYIATNADHAAAQSTYTGRRRTNLTIAVAGALGAVALTLIALNTTSPSPGVILGAVGSAAVFGWCALDALRYGEALAEMDQSTRVTGASLSRESRSFAGPSRIEIGPDGIVHASVHEDIRQRWGGIADVHHTFSSIAIVRDDGYMYILPKRVFASLQQASEVAERCRAWLERSGAGDVARARAWLETHDLPCPKCGYNLRGGEPSSCPECGMHFSPEFIADIPSHPGQPR